MSFSLQLSARNLPNKDRFSKSDPFLILFKISESGAPRFVKRTETKKNNLNPDWSELMLDKNDIDWSQKDSLIKFDIMDDDGRGKAEHLGSCVARVYQVEAAYQESRGLQLRGSGGEEAGTLLVRGLSQL